MTTTLLCLHGMDATSRVWDGVAGAWSHGPVLSPDLAGHGSGPRLGRYHLDDYADDVIDRLGDRLVDRFVVLGHSMGGAVGLALAARHRLLGLLAVVGIGIKATWSDDELAAMGRIADKGPARFDDEHAARQRFLRLSGLSELVPVDSDVAGSGVAPVEGGGWRLAVDPEVHRMQRIDIGRLVANAGVPVLLTRGSLDAMVPSDDVERFGVSTAEIAGAGHNAHVEDPDATLALAARFA